MMLLSNRNFIAFKTIVIKEITRFTRIWLQTLVAPVITIALYFLIFGNLIGTRIGTMRGFTYSEYIAPGLIMMAVITNTYTNIASSVFIARLQKHIEELVVSPMSNTVLLWGYVTASITRGLLTGLGVTIVALFFTKLHLHSLTITLLTALLASLLFSLAGFANALYAKGFDDIAIVPTFILTPLTYLGGVFYSVSLLPKFWENVSHLNPILYMVSAFRYGILGISDINIGVALLVMVFFVLVLLLLNIYLLNKGVGIRH